MLLLGALSLFAAAPAAADVLVSNIGQTAGRDNTRGIHLARAQSFTTGSNALGYALESIEARFRVGRNLNRQETASVTAQLWSATSSGRPSLKIADLTTPSGIGSTNNSFDAPAGTTLAPSTTYLVRFFAPDLHQVRVVSTTSDNEDSGAAAGWSIGISSYTYSSGTWRSDNSSFNIRVNGSALQQVSNPQPWSGTLTAKSLSGGNFGCSNVVTAANCSSTSVLSDDDFTFSGTAWEITQIAGSSTALTVIFNRDVRTALDSYNFCVGTTALAFSSASHSGGNGYAIWSTTAANWSASSTPSLSIRSSSSCTASTNANLGRLTAASSTSSTGTFTDFNIGAFSAATTAYTATVANDQTHVKLTPTVADTGATVGVRKGTSGNFTAVTSGTASSAVALDVGANTITVRVTAEDGTTMKDYTVTVTRRVAPSSTPIWSGMLTVQDISAGQILGCTNPSTGNECSSTSILDDDDFTISGTSWDITAITDRSDTDAVTVFFNRDVRTALDSYTFCVGSTALAFSDAGHAGDNNSAAWIPTRGWTVGATVRVSIGGASCGQDSTPTPTQAQAPPTGLTVTPGDALLRVSWTAPSNAADNSGYDLHFTSATVDTVANDAAASGTDPAVAWISTRRNPNNAATSYTIDSDDATPTNGVTYRVRLRMSSPESAWVFGTDTPRAAVPAPTVNAVSGTMTVGDGGSWKGFQASSNTGALSDTDFTSAGVSYRILGLRLTSSGFIDLQLDKVVARELGLVLDVGGSRFSFADAVLSTGPDHEGVTAGWGYANQGETPPSWSVNDTVAVSLGASASSTVKLAVRPNPVWEGSWVSVEACLSAVPRGATRIPVTLSHGGTSEAALEKPSETGDWGVSRSGQTDGSLPIFTAYSITIDDWFQSRCGVVNIPTHRDSDLDDDTFMVALDTTSLPLGMQPGSPASVEVRIKDLTDLPEVSLRAVRWAVPEGSQVELQAVLTKPLARDVEIPLRVRGVTAERPDYGSITSIMIAAGSTTGSGTISTSRDDDTDDERFDVAVVLRDLPSGVAPGMPSDVGIRIVDGANARLRALDLSGN